MKHPQAAKARFFIGLVGLAAISALTWLALWVVVAPPTFGWSAVAVTSGSMEPAVSTGDIVIVEPTDGVGLGSGTIIVFDDPSSEGRITHRIVDTTPQGDYVTRGDANRRIDSTPVSPDKIVGVGRLLVPAMGTPIVWLEQDQHLLFVLLIFMIGIAAWAARWAVLSKYDPWQSGVTVPPAPGGRRRLTVGLSSATGVVIASLLVAAVTTSTHSRALFATPSNNANNSMIADTLEPPTALTTSGTSNVTLDWTITPDTYATGHRIYRATNPGGPYTSIGQVTPHTTSTYLDTPPPGTYYYVVRAYTTNWLSTNSTEASATVITPEDFDAIPPGSDNCPTTFNFDQLDTDGDTIGDACDPSPTVPSTATFSSNGQSLGNARSEGVVLGDIDSDGDLDAIVANNGNPSEVWLNNGNGTFTPGQTLGTSASINVVLGDLDGDGDLDIIIANKKAASSVWINNGSGTFTNSGQALGNADTRTEALGDVDGDGDLDVVFANHGGNQVWLNNGTGTFTAGQALDWDHAVGVALGDLDGDSDLDMMLVSDSPGNTNSVWINNGSGVFANSGQSLGSSDSHDVAFSDIDGDGDLDAIVANNGPNVVWINNGTGTFTPGQTLGSSDSHSVKFGDLDGDGDLDAMIANNGDPNTVWINNGTGTFTASQTLITAASHFLALGDLDSDGDLDAMIANNGAPNTVWINDAGPPIQQIGTWQSNLTQNPGTGQNRMLVFVATNEQQRNTTPTLTAVTYGGQALTPVISNSINTNCCTADAELWVLDDAGIAAAVGTNLIPTWTSTPDTPLYASGIFTNVAQQQPIGATTTAISTGPTPNPVPLTPLPTAAGDMVIGVGIASEQGTYTALNGFTLGLGQATSSGGTTAQGVAYKSANGSEETVSMVFTSAASFIRRQVVLAAVLNGAP